MDDVNPREGDLPSPVDPVDPPPSSDQSAYTPPTWDVPDSEATETSGQYAGYGWRVLGYLIDAIILGAVLGIASRLLSLGVYGDFAVGFVLRGLYAGILIASWRGQTLGMRVAKVVCVDAATRGPVPLAQSMIRAFSAELLAAISLFGLVGSLAQLTDFVWPIWDKMNQTLHDKIGRTVVLR